MANFSIVIVPTKKLSNGRPLAKDSSAHLRKPDIYLRSLF